MTDSPFDWQSFLSRWSGEWADACDPDPDQPLDASDEQARRNRWLGFEPATAERIAALEQRAGRPLPPSYRAFLEVSDGWRHAGGFVYRLAGAADTDWFEDDWGLGDLLEDEGEAGEEQVDEERLRWTHALQLDRESDCTYILLNPADADADGEWAVYDYRSWRASPPERHSSFREFMTAMYREFHQLQAGDRSGREFANDTTREQDALLDLAREDALSGEFERAEAALAEAQEYGRPPAEALRAQILRLQGQTYLVRYGDLAVDPVYAPEIVPVLAIEQLRNSHWEHMWDHELRGATEEVRAAADETLRQLRELDFRYTASGPFGAAVERARELARWGGTDAAWQTLLDALPQWTPPGPDLLAPLGLLADTVLGPLLTPERGRELLATPRAGRAGRAPERMPAADPGGLAWLSEYEFQGPAAGYRFILVEGAQPADLPARLGPEGSTELGRPVSATDRRPNGTGFSSTYSDDALAVVGRAAPDWSFAFDRRPNPYYEPRYVSPAAAASGPGRAVVVWSVPARPHRPTELFHLSVAENGEERYAFTVTRSAEAGLEIRRSGPIPPSLEPDHLFVPEADDPRTARRAEGRALAAIAAEFGVSLPRFALTESRLHTLTTRSWTRPPGTGESYITMQTGPRRATGLSASNRPPEPTERSEQ